MSASAPARVLHVGCGQRNPEKLPERFRGPGWVEVRLDIDPAVEPDIVASITDMAVVASASFEALFSSHNLEHLYPHEVPVALLEFRRVLKPGGVAVVTLPDLQHAARLIAEDRLEEVAYRSVAGPVSAIDMVFGFRPALARGNLFMAHHTGFTARTLAEHLGRAGFADITVSRDDAGNLWAVAHAA